jgi:hypothetical protein
VASRIVDERMRAYYDERAREDDGLAQELGGGEVLHAGRWFVGVAVR